MRTHIQNAFNMHGNPIGEIFFTGDHIEIYYSDTLCDSQMNFVEWAARRMGLKVLDLNSNFALLKK